jgi:hypothetical protein
MGYNKGSAGICQVPAGDKGKDAPILPREEARNIEKRVFCGII